MSRYAAETVSQAKLEVGDCRRTFTVGMQRIALITTVKNGGSDALNDDKARRVRDVGVGSEMMLKSKSERSGK